MNGLIETVKNAEHAVANFISGAIKDEPVKIVVKSIDGYTSGGGHVWLNTNVGRIRKPAHYLATAIFEE